MGIRYDKFEVNFKRVDSLIKLFERTRESTRRMKITETDILRAAVVLLHSAMEDYLRGIIIEYLPKRGRDELKNISLPDNDRRAEKFTLGDLIEFRSNTISELIEQSVKAHLQKVSFNNTTDILSWIKRIGVRIDKMEVDLASINSMIERRHKIVHEADANPNAGRGHHMTTPIDAEKTKGWMVSVEKLISNIEKYLQSSDFLETT